MLLKRDWIAATTKRKESFGDGTHHAALRVGSLRGDRCSLARVFAHRGASAEPPRLAAEDVGHKPFQPIYNPYPLGLLPSDLEDSDRSVARVYFCLPRR